jgi:serine/threonine protein kinase
MMVSSSLSSYGKPTDVWATGFIMYELMTGTHPLWVKGEDKAQYKEKLKNIKKFTFPPGNYSP